MALTSELPIMRLCEKQLSLPPSITNGWPLANTVEAVPMTAITPTQCMGNLGLHPM
jgi:hypothetical protein